MAGINFNTKGFDEVSAYLESLESGLANEVAKKGLKAGHQAMQPTINKISATMIRSGNMDRRLLRAPEIEELGMDIFSVGIGFKIRDSGIPNQAFHSIYIMHGTPRIRPHNALYDAAQGTKARNAFKKAFREALQKHMERNR